MPRVRKPEALKRLEGTFRKDRQPHGVDMPAGLPDKPEWATHDPVASALYDQVATHCHSMGVGTEVDALGFALLADQLSMYLRLRALVAADGPIIFSEGSTGQKTQKPHAALAQMNTAYTNIVKLMTEYGLTAASRTKEAAKPPLEVASLDSFLSS